MWNIFFPHPIIPFHPAKRNTHQVFKFILVFVPPIQIMGATISTPTHIHPSLYSHFCNQNNLLKATWNNQGNWDLMVYIFLIRLLWQYKTVDSFVTCLTTPLLNHKEQDALSWSSAYKPLRQFEAILEF